MRYSMLLLLALAACKAAPPPAPPPPDPTLAASDSFSGPPGTDLDGRVSESGHAWKRAGRESLALTPDGTARPVSISSEGAAYVLGWVPESPDYAVEARLVPRGLTGDGWHAAVLARVSAPHAVVLAMEAHDSTFQVALRSTADTLLAESRWERLELRPYVIRLVVRGDTAIGFVDGLEQVRVRTGVAVAEGPAGIWAYQEDVPEDRNGLQFDDFRVYAR